MPRKATTKPKVTAEPIADNQDKIVNEVEQVIEVQESKTNFSIDPRLLEKMMVIGDNAYWHRILETFVGDMNRRYRR